jgi:hypothetical protein
MAQANFHDITSGNNGYSAHTGYDLVTGRGTPRAAAVIQALVAAAGPGNAAVPPHSTSTSTGTSGTATGHVQTTPVSTPTASTQIDPTLFVATAQAPPSAAVTFAPAAIASPAAAAFASAQVTGSVSLRTGLPSLTGLSSGKATIDTLAFPDVAVPGAAPAPDGEEAAWLDQLFGAADALPLDSGGLALPAGLDGDAVEES